MSIASEGLRSVWRGAAGVALTGVLLWLSACRRDSQADVVPSAAAAPSASTPASLPKADLVPIPVPGRLVLVGDLHGDLDVARRALKLAGATDERGKWTGGNQVLVLLGDLLDRGEQERALLDWVSELEVAAPAAGGRLVVLLGNHEAMNVAGDLRYVTSSGLRDFASFAPADGATAFGDAAPASTWGRLAAFLPGGPYARKLAAHPAIAVVGDTLVVHGGLLPEHVRYGLGRVNREFNQWMLGSAPPSLAITSERSPLWVRDFGERKVPKEACAKLDEVLTASSARRMVIGHSVQDKGIDPACHDKVWRIDVGLSRFYGGPLQLLEITAAGPRVLSAEPAAH